MAKILLVEDNEMNRDMLVRRLERHGYLVVVAHDGAPGLQLAQAEAPDVILMDMSRPILDGWEATRQLKALPSHTGHSDHRPDRPWHGRRPGKGHGSGL
jgi:CheY-like chemotaxis protein